MRNIIYIPDNTWTDLDQEPIFLKFMKEYLDLLQTNLQKVNIRSKQHSSTYYTCGQPHDSQNPSWQPFKLLSQLCKKYGYDNLIAREIIEEHIHRKFEGECQILGNPQGKVPPSGDPGLHTLLIAIN